MSGGKLFKESQVTDKLLSEFLCNSHSIFHK